MNKYFYQSTLIFLAILFSTIAYSSPVRQFRQIEQLSNRDVLDIKKDKYGFIWFGHNSGIIRYDGYELVEYSTKETNDKWIPMSAVWTIFIDSKDRMWLGGGIEGCALYNYETETFQPFLETFGSDTLPIGQTKDFTEDDSGTIWTCSNNGIYYKPDSSDKFFKSKLFFEPGNESIVFHSIFHQKPGRIWLGDVMGNLYIYNTRNNTLIRYNKGIFSNKSSSPNRILQIFPDSKNNLWVCGDHIAVKINTDTHEQHSIADRLLDNHKIMHITEDADGLIYISAGGLNVYNPDTDIMEHYSNRKNDSYSISSNVTNKLYIDNNSVLWIGSWYGGADMHYKDMKPFTLHTISENKNSISDNTIHCFFEDEDKYIWIGTEDGILNRYNPATGKYKHYTDPGMTINEAITGITNGAHEHELLVATWGALKIFNKNTGAFTRIVHDENNPDGIGGNNLPGLTKYKDNILLGIEWAGLQEFNPATKEFINHSKLASEECYEDLSFVRTIQPDYQGNIWVVGWASLFKYNIRNKCFEKIIQSNTDPFSLRDGRVFCCFVDSKDRIWIGNTNGISLYNSEEDYFMSFSEKDGLNGSDVLSIVEDNDGNLWLATDKGISKFTLPSKVTEITRDSVYTNYLPDNFIYFFNYDKNDGLIQEKFLGGSIISSDGTAYFGGTGGFNTFKPGSITEDTTQSPLRLIELKLFNKTIKPLSSNNPDSPLKKSITLSDKIELDHKQFIFSLKWAALNYYSPQKVDYAYILDGFEKEWNYCGINRTATYTALPPGDYIFRVKSTNSDGIWNQNEAKINITILPPWWGKLWFKILIVSVIAILIVIYNYNRINSLRRQKSKLQKLVKKRTKALEKANTTKDKFFSIIAHDLRNPFNAILGYIQLLYDDDEESYTREERKNMYKSVLKVSNTAYNLLENLLTWARSQSGKIQYNYEAIEANQIVSETINLLKSSADKKEIDIIIDNKEPFIVSGDKNSIETILRNLISNAIKFTTRNGSITINISKTEKTGTNYILFSITDTGVGMSKEALNGLFSLENNISTKGTEKESGTGLGLILCKEFVKKNGGKIWAESEPGNGSTFSFRIPEFS